MLRLTTLLAVTLATGCSAVLDFDPFRGEAADAGPETDAGLDAGPGPDADAGPDMSDAATDAPTPDACAAAEICINESDDDCDGRIDEGCLRITAGDSHTCAMDSLGGAWCWGENVDGRVGGTSAGPIIRPRPVDLTTVTAISAGGQHTCAIEATVTWCWGLNDQLQLVDPDALDMVSDPVETVDEPSFLGPADGLSAGGKHTCNARSDGRVTCGGGAGDGQLGREVPAGGPPADTPRFEVVPGITDAILVTSGGRHTCAVGMGGISYCWGANDAGQIGDGSMTQRNEPVLIAGLAGVVDASAGTSHTCAVAVDTLYCWGANADGQLGRDDTVVPRERPGIVLVPDGAPVARVSAGDRHTCAVTLAGDLYCWGANESNQLGTGGVDPLLAPEEPVAILDPVADVAAGGSHTCAVTTAGDVYCWGANDAGQLGIGSTSAPIGEPTHVEF